MVEDFSLWNCIIYRLLKSECSNFCYTLYGNEIWQCLYVYTVYTRLATPQELKPPEREVVGHVQWVYVRHTHIQVSESVGPPIFWPYFIIIHEMFIPGN